MGTATWISTMQALDGQLLEELPDVAALVLLVLDVPEGVAIVGGKRGVGSAALAAVHLVGYQLQQVLQHLQSPPQLAQ